MDWHTKYLTRPWHAEQFNCWDLVRAVYAEKLSVTLPTFSEMATDLEAVASRIEAERAAPSWVPTDEQEPYAVAVMGKGRLVHHVGVIIAPGLVLHTRPKVGGRVESVRRLQSEFQTLKFYRYA